jgi:hypothetical protein
MARTQRTRRKPASASASRFDLAFRPRSYRWPRKPRNDAAISAAEVTIARIGLSTPHRDLITLRARRGGDGRIRYRMIHEGAAAPATRRIRARPVSSERPLALGELVEMLDRAYYEGACANAYDQECYGHVIWGTLRLHFEHGIGHADEYLFFASVESEHYPQLEAYYRARLAEWCLEHCEEEEDCGKIVRMRMRRG